MSDNTRKNIKDLPEKQRPYEKCIQCGAATLSDEELLAVIIRTGCVGKQATELSSEIIKLGGDNGLLGICRLTERELLQIRGVGMVKAVQIRCICELSKRISRGVAVKKQIFNSPAVIADYYMEECRHKEREELKVIMLNSKSVYLGDVNVSVGTVNASFASAREIYLEALKYKAVNICLLHNHPSGDPTPSRSDIESTQKIVQAGEIIGIRLMDHIIIGDNRYVSFKENGII